MRMRWFSAMTVRAVPVFAMFLFCAPASADDVINVSAARDNARVFELFMQRTGIKVNVLQERTEQTIARLGGASTPAPDVIIGGDLASLTALQDAGAFAPYSSSLIDERVPAHLRDSNRFWFGLIYRARAIFYNPSLLAKAPERYEDLASDALRGKVCIGSGKSPYNVVFLGDLIANGDEAVAERWARAMVANRADAPDGHDPAQILNVGAGRCAVTIAQHYYYLILKSQNKPENQAALDQVKLVWPNQADRGVALNASGVGLAKSVRNKDAAMKLLEFLVSDEAQGALAGNYFFPAVSSAPVSATLAGLGRPKVDPVDLSRVAAQLGAARAIVDRVSWPSPPPRRAAPAQ